MYRKYRRRRQRFYPEFYGDEIENEPEPEQETPLANYNDLLYPNNLKTDSVFNQLENIQKEYIKKKLDINRNNINLDPYMTVSDENINRNEEENMSETNNEVKIEIPDSMYTGEIAVLHGREHENTADGNAAPDVPQNYPEINDLNENEYILTPDSDDASEYSEEAAPTFEHIAEPEQFAGTPEPVHEQITEQPVITEPEPPAPFVEPVREYNSEMSQFDKVKAIEYAHRWALDRNPNFFDFEELGGDCTNYISQILLAGGCKMDHAPVHGWYYINGNDKSPSWTGVEELYNYLMKEKERGVIAEEISAEEVRAGDIVQLSFNGRNYQHTPFIVEVSRSEDAPFDYDQIKICAHSFDSQNRALASYQWRKIRCIRILGNK